MRREGTGGEGKEEEKREGGRRDGAGEGGRKGKKEGKVKMKGLGEERGRSEDMKVGSGVGETSKGDREWGKGRGGSGQEEAEGNPVRRNEGGSKLGDHFNGSCLKGGEQKKKKNCNKKKRITSSSKRSISA